MNIITSEMVDRLVVSQGNVSRILELIYKAEQGEEVTIAFLGGSITQGARATSPDKCYAYRVFDWFVKKYPLGKVKYVNAGIGGTTSQFGVSRVAEDVLDYNPDLCFLEFSVNDEADEFFMESYEGTLRRLYFSEKNPGVIIINNLFYEDGHNAQDQHNAIGMAYGVPCLSIRDALYPLIEKEELRREDVTPDNLHPNDLGHQILAELIISFLERVTKIAHTDKELQAMMEYDWLHDQIIITDPITVNAMEDLIRVQNDNCAQMVSCQGFIADSRPKADLRDLFKKGWTASKKGDKIGLTFTGSELAVQYRRTINRPAPIVRAVLDGDYENSILLDGNFDEDWGDCLYIDTLLYHGRRLEQNKQSLADLAPIVVEHTLELVVEETHDNDASDFYLVSFIIG